VGAGFRIERATKQEPRAGFPTRISANLLQANTKGVCDQTVIKKGARCDDGATLNIEKAARRRLIYKLVVIY
jgi:hypothetical protein